MKPRPSGRGFVVSAGIELGAKNGLHYNGEMEDRAHTSFAPVSATERLEVLDVLRGFALFGVLLSNLETTSGETIAMTAAQAAALPTASWDGGVLIGLRFFVNGKFIALFTLLFGLGFVVQRQRALDRDANFPTIYARRQLVLLCIGLLHILLWWGDILHFYALVGLLLLATVRLSNRWLLILGVGLTTLPYTLLNGWGAIRRAFGGSGPEAFGGFDREALLAQRVARLTEGSWHDIVAENLAIYSDFYSPRRAIAMAGFILGYFLLGVLLGRLGILHQPSRHRDVLRRLWIWGALVGLLGGAVMLATLQFGLVSFQSTWILPCLVLSWIGVAALASSYLAAIALLMDHDGGRRWIRWLGPVGRMALTNYLMHSLFYLLLLDRFEVASWTVGLGWLGSLGATGCLTLSLVLFALQVAFSHLWLRQFRFGPVEWLWRSLTYGKRQAWRH